MKFFAFALVALALSVSTADARPRDRIAERHEARVERREARHAPAGSNCGPAAAAAVSAVGSNVGVAACGPKGCPTPTASPTAPR